MHFHIHIPTEQGEDNIEHLLIMPLGIGIITVRNGETVRLKETEHLVKIIPILRQIHLGNGSIFRFLTHFNIVGQKAFHQSYAYLGIRYVKQLFLHSYNSCSCTLITVVHVPL